MNNREEEEQRGNILVKMSICTRRTIRTSSPLRLIACTILACCIVSCRGVEDESPRTVGNKPRFGLLTFASGKKYRHAVAPALETKRKYCERHKYTCHLESAVRDSSRAPAWSKLDYALELLPKYDFLFLSDADVVILNPAITLESLVSQHMEDPAQLFLLSHDWNSLSTGNMILRNAPKTLELLKQLKQTSQYNKHGNYEQQAFLEFYNANTNNLKDSTKVLKDNTIMNTYVTTLKERIVEKGQRGEGSIKTLGGEYEYRPGHFLVHLAGLREPEILGPVVGLIKSAGERGMLVPEVVVTYVDEIRTQYKVMDVAGAGQVLFFKELVDGNAGARHEEL